MLRVWDSIYKHSSDIVKGTPNTLFPIGISLIGVGGMCKALSLGKLNFKHALLTMSVIFVTKHTFHALFALGYMGYKGEEEIKSCEVVKVCSVLATLVAGPVTLYVASRCNFDLETRRWVVFPVWLVSLLYYSPVVISLHTKVCNHKGS